MNRLNPGKRAAILTCLTEGMSVSATARVTSTSKVTVLKLLADAGTVVLDYQRKVMVNLPCTRIEADEIWSFVGAKERNIPRDQKGRGRGDAWTWTAICTDTKLVPCFHVGARDAEAARLFMDDLASRLARRVQLTTDGLNGCIGAVEGAFGWNGVDYAMLVKVYGQGPDGQRRYSAPELIDTEKTRIMGKPDMSKASTSYAERQNLTMRMNIRRLTRLTNGFSKKLENHVHAMSLYFMAYNFCRKHETLTKERGGIHTTPAMAAGLTDHVWKMAEVVALLD